MKFSVVIPIKGTVEESKLIEKTLPSYYSIKPSEIILAIDNPVEYEPIIKKIQLIMKQYHGENITEILKVKKGDEGWGDQQMKARRTGFLATKYNRVLTGDIDLIVNKNVFKAISMVGKNKIGLASCAKFRLPHNFLDFIRVFSTTVLTKLGKLKSKMGATTFTGLYAFWKPCWKEVEPIERAKKFWKLKAKARNKEPIGIEDFFGTGDDTFLRDEMVQKYKVVYLSDVGAFVLTDPWEERPIIQYGKGVYFAVVQKRNTFIALARALIRLQPYYFAGHVFGRKLLKKGLTKRDFLWETS